MSVLYVIKSYSALIIFLSVTLFTFFHLFWMWNSAVTVTQFCPLMHNCDSGWTGKNEKTHLFLLILAFRLQEADIFPNLCAPAVTVQDTHCVLLLTRCWLWCRMLVFSDQKKEKGGGFSVNREALWGQLWRLLQLCVNIQSHDHLWILGSLSPDRCLIRDCEFSISYLGKRLHCLACCGMASPQQAHSVHTSTVYFKNLNHWKPADILVGCASRNHTHSSPSLLNK